MASVTQGPISASADQDPVFCTPGRVKGRPRPARGVYDAGPCQSSAARLHTTPAVPGNRRRAGESAGAGSTARWRGWPGAPAPDVPWKQSKFSYRNSPLEIFLLKLPRNIAAALLRDTITSLNTGKDAQFMIPPFSKSAAMSRRGRGGGWEAAGSTPEEEPIPFHFVPGQWLEYCGTLAPTSWAGR